MTDPTPTPPSKAAQALLVGGSSKPPPDGELASSPWRLAAIAGGVLALGVAFGWGWIFIITALTVMIFLHELGHFATAKWSGMKVTEFCFLGVGPKLWSARRGETEYMVRLIPVLAYVRIIGMNNLDECDPADEPRTFRQQSFPKRLLVMSGGSLMHFAQALVLFIVVFAFVGVPGDTGLAQDLGGAAPHWGVTEVVKGEGAAKAGILAGDEIRSINGRAVDDVDQVRPLVKDHAGDTIPIEVERDGELRSIEVTVGRNPDAKPGANEAGFLGVVMGQLDVDALPTVTVGPLDAVYEGGRATGNVMWQTLQGLGSFATGGVGDFAHKLVGGGDDGAQGPVVSSEGSGSTAASGSSDDESTRAISIFGVARIGADAAENSLGEVLLLLAVVNISIGLINLLPLLPFDGGHIAIAVYERIRSRKGHRHMTDVSRLLPLTYAVVLVLGMIMVSSLYLDIVDPIGLR